MNRYEQISNARLTGRGYLSSVAHESIKQVLDCRTIIIEVVRSTDGCEGIRSQVIWGSGTKCAQESLVDGEVPRRHVVFGTSAERDVMSLGSLQNRSRKLEELVVHFVAPRQRVVQEIKNHSFCGVSNRTLVVVSNRTFHGGGGSKTDVDPPAIQLEG